MHFFVYADLLLKVVATSSVGIELYQQLEGEKFAWSFETKSSPFVLGSGEKNG